MTRHEILLENYFSETTRFCHLKSNHQNRTNPSSFTAAIKQQQALLSDLHFISHSFIDDFIFEPNLDLD